MKFQKTPAGARAFSLAEFRKGSGNEVDFPFLKSCSTLIKKSINFKKKLADSPFNCYKMCRDY